MFFKKSLKIILVLTFIFSVSSKADSLTNKIIVDKWLSAGPFKLSLPALSKSTDKLFHVKDLLSFESKTIKNFVPVKGKELQWNNNKTEWEEKTGENGEVFLQKISGSAPEIIYLAVYLNASRFVKGNIEISSCHLFEIFLNGNEIVSNSQSKIGVDTICVPENKKADLKLEPGKHLLIIKTIKDPDITSKWSIKTVINPDNNFNKDDLEITTSPVQFVSVENLLDDPKAGDISISPDGELAAVTVTQVEENGNKKNNRIEIIKTKDGSNLNTMVCNEISSLKWHPQNRILSYIIKENNNSSIVINNLDNGTVTKILDKEKNLSSYEWSPDGSFIIYSLTEKADSDKSGLVKIDEPKDRLPGAKDISSLYKIDINSLTKIRLTAGDKTTDLHSISSDGSKVLFSTTTYNLSERPFSYSTLYILHLTDMKLDSLFSEKWISSAGFSPDGKQLLVLAGPSAFNGAGINVPDEMMPNDYDTQAYLYAISSGKVEAVTKYFNPKINSFYWSRLEDIIYFSVEEGSLQPLYRYDLKEKKFSKTDIQTEILTSIDFSENNLSAVYKGSSALIPDQVFYINLKSGESKLLYDPSKKSFEFIKTGKAKEWSFINNRGDKIDGLVYYPPDFEENKNYPGIVYYYGGTNPVEQSFEGRYPKNIWAAHGYIVYVLQPSGATGYGQTFSAYHVNDWGEITAEEIIKGTREFLSAHPFVDPEKVGCIGASYGGFMTMNVLTKTDIFAAAISHAGISTLSSYWGEGFWGYTYSAVATANSFPWNRKDIYVDKSPLFNADKITTPLLLLHGADDTNVPVGESIQMFTALKILGRVVELIQVEGQDHHILEYKKRKQWTKTIIAWFDKYLKDQPELYENMYNKD